MNSNWVVSQLRKTNQTPLFSNALEELHLPKVNMLNKRKFRDKSEINLCTTIQEILNFISCRDVGEVHLLIMENEKRKEKGLVPASRNKGCVLSCHITNWWDTSHWNTFTNILFVDVSQWSIISNQSLSRKPSSNSRQFNSAHHDGPMAWFHLFTMSPTMGAWLITRPGLL